MREESRSSGRFRLWTSVRGDRVCFVVIMVLVYLMQRRTVVLGLHYDDYLVFRHYPAMDVLRSFWTDLAEVTAPEFWISAWRPMTLAAHAAVFELFGFHPEGLLIARVLLQSATGILLFRWLRLQNMSVSASLFGTAGYLFYPVNFHVFTWNTELGAVCGLLWLLGSLVLHLQWVQSGDSVWLRRSCCFWALALLTKEVVVPVTFLFLIMDVFYGRTLRVRALLLRWAPWLLILVIYLLLRSWILQGRWGGQGSSPDSLTAWSFLQVAAVNYRLFLQNIVLADTLSVLHPESPLPGMIAFLPLPLMGLRLSILLAGHARCFDAGRGFGTVAIRAGLSAVRDAAPSTRTAATGFFLIAGGGLICCFYPADRIMYVAVLGCGLVWAALAEYLLEQLHQTSVRNGRMLTAVICLILTVCSMHLYHRRIFSPSSPFVKSAERFDLEAYFLLSHLFPRWDARPQAEFLKARLDARGLLHEDGRPDSQAISALLIVRGFDQQEIEELLTSLEGRRGAVEAFETQNAVSEPP